jgi:hypothetical protein
MSRQDASPRSVEERRAEADRYDVRGLHPNVRIGSASDRSAGWIGQVYPRDVWAGEVTSKPKRVGNESLDDRTLPVASAEDYFLHFPDLEIDFTYYRPLLDPAGTPSPGVFQLQQYADHAPPSARFLLKAPQQFLARRVRRTVAGRVQYVENPAFLDSDAFEAHFLAPARDLLGVKLAGVILEQPYERARDSPSPEAFVAEWDRFVRDLPSGPPGAPGGVPLHLEVRSPHLLSPAYLDWLAGRGLGFCFSHWQWLPTLGDQWRLVGERFTSGTGTAVVRLMQPREMTFDESFRLAHPFDAPVPELSETGAAKRMVDEAVALMYKAIDAGVTLHVVGNNRAWGNTPDLARTLAHRFLDFAERRGQ